MRSNSILLGVFTLLISQISCDWMPGRPKVGPEVNRPEEVKSFDILYSQNCSGCHGKNGDNGPAINLANPEYQALVDDGTLRKVIADGQAGTMMPGFALSSGGPLTDQQIGVLVDGMRANWKKSESAPSSPRYAASLRSNSENGRHAYDKFCSRCHGSSTGQPGSAGSVMDGTYLGLVSDQAIRTAIIAGRPDLGMPDWRNDVTGTSMSDQEITDVIAWLSSQRPKTPGQPYPATPARHRQEPQ